jgi:heme/copper-type cytochrome/quinol oxidase subunit 1
MHLKEIKIYHCFWIISILIVIIGLIKNLSSEDNVFDINIHDTYYVISNLDLTVFLSFLYFLNGFGYWIVQKKLKKNLIKSLTIIHSLILIGGFISYWLVLGYSKLFIKSPFPLFDDYVIINQTLVIIASLIVAIGIPIYSINLMIGIFKKRTANR